MNTFTLEELLAIYRATLQMSDEGKGFRVTQNG